MATRKQSTTPLAESKRFLQLVYSALPVDHFIEFRAFDATAKSRPRVQFFGSVDDPSIDSFLQNHSNLNIHPGIASRRSRDGKKSSLGQTEALWIDIDDPQLTLKDVLKNVKKLELPKPSLIVHSGNGLHVYWLLDDPVELKTQDGIKRVERANIILRELFGGDACQNADRIMRLPGTTNHPNPKKIRRGYKVVPCKIIHDTNDRYDFDKLAEQLESYAHQTTKAHKVDTVGDIKAHYEPPATEITGYTEAVIKAIRKNPQLKKRCAGNTDGLSDKSQSGLDFSIASLMAQMGVPGADIHLAVRSLARKRGDEKRESYYKSTVSKVLGSLRDITKKTTTHEQGAINGVDLLDASLIQMRKTVWLWYPRIPVGCLTMLDGEPGSAKSTILTDLAARLTKGVDAPDGTPLKKTNVLYITVEDSAEETIIPRFVAAGGDTRNFKVLKRITVHDENGEESKAILQLPEHADYLRQMIREQKFGMIIIDPLDSHTEENIKTGVGSSVRRMLVPLMEIAEEEKCSILAVRHTIKDTSGKNAAMLGAGSYGGFTGAARSVLLASRNPFDPHEHLLSVTKCNLAANKSHAVAYVVEPTFVNGKKKEKIETTKVNWLGSREVKRHELTLAPQDFGTQEKQEVQFLNCLEAGGRLMPSKDLHAELGAVHGLGASTLKKLQAGLVEQGKVRVFQKERVWYVERI